MLRKTIANTQTPSKKFISQVVTERNVSVILQSGEYNNWYFSPRADVLINADKLSDKDQLHVFRMEFGDTIVPKFGPSDFLPVAYVCWQKLEDILLEYKKTEDPNILEKLKPLFEVETQNEASLTALLNYVYYNIHSEGLYDHIKIIQDNFEIIHNPQVDVFAEVFRLNNTAIEVKMFPIKIDNTKSAFENPALIIEILKKHVVHPTSDKPVAIMPAKFIFGELFKADYAKLGSFEKQSSLYLQKGMFQIYKLFKAFWGNSQFRRQITD